MSLFLPSFKGVPDKPGIIISRADKIGDLILSIPSFNMARRMYPEGRIAVLVRSYNAGIVKNLPFIDETWIIDGDFSDLKKRMKAFRADVFAALYSDRATLKAAAASGAPFRAGPLSKPLSWLVYNKGIIQKRSRSVKNEAEYNLDIIKALNPELFGKRYETGGRITCSAENVRRAEAYLEKNGVKGPYIIIHPFAGGSAKNLTEAQYAAIADKTAAMAPDSFIIMTASESDFPRLEAIKGSIPAKNVLIYKNGPDILDLAALIERAEVYAGGSTGPSHIAGNMRKKAVLIYPAKKSQSPVRWGLFGDDLAQYVIPDENNPGEDYSKKSFDCITEDTLNDIALRIFNKFKMRHEGN